MATGTNPSGATPSDPRELIFHSDRDSNPTHIRRRKRWYRQPLRITFSLALGALFVWMYAQAAERLSQVIDPLFPGWVYYVMLCVFGILGFALMYRWLKT